MAGGRQGIGMAGSNETVYIKADRDIEVTKPDVTLGDVLTLECSNPAVVSRIKAIKLLKFHHVDDKHQNRTAVSILKVIQCIHECYPNIEVQNMGETDFIVTYEEQQTAGGAVHYAKAVIVVIISFLGAAFSIMAFNNDVDTTKMFAQIYELLTGRQSDGFTILELTYSIGLIIGILTFFNHFGKKKFTVDPTPMEVEMRLYENDIQTTLIETYSRKEKELDVGSTDPDGSHRT
jgi:stage V sporulation protein AA